MINLKLGLDPLLDTERLNGVPFGMLPGLPDELSRNSAQLIPVMPCYTPTATKVVGTLRSTPQGQVIGLANTI